MKQVLNGTRQYQIALSLALLLVTIIIYFQYDQSFTSRKIMDNGVQTKKLTLSDLDYYDTWRKIYKLIPSEYSMGHIGMFPKQCEFYSILSEKYHRICEIGFGWGHSSAVFLRNPSNHLRMFDIWHEMKNSIHLLFNKLYGERFMLTKINSENLTPSHLEGCDLISIDAVHDGYHVDMDTRNSCVLNPGSALLFDDCEVPSIKDVLINMELRGFINNLIILKHPNFTNPEMSIGYYGPHQNKEYCFAYCK